MTSRRGLLIVISGPSGVGKDTLIEHLLKLDANLRYSVSYTTRAPRPGEVDGVNYRFVSREQFEKLIQQVALLEHATYNGNLYGTPAAPVQEARAAGFDIVLKIEVHGARLVRQRAADGLFIFLAPPSTEELVRRQELRQSESRKDMAERLLIADKEMTYAADYDFVVVNDEIDRAVAEVLAIIRKARERQT
ncbi:MAG TPA: guanylate kinase [Candidatus Dormibacteraeota bacterium]|nr:guanylate kinase [Candidatus Dormibacteraeota bacterium]